MLLFLTKELVDEHFPLLDDTNKIQTDIANITIDPKEILSMSTLMAGARAW
jgi:hypothetical protein